MNKLIAVLLVILTASQAVHADTWYRDTDEWAIPHDIHTEADVRRYEDTRKGFIIAGVFATLATVILDKNAKGLKHKADSIDTRGDLILTPVAGGGIQVTQGVIVGLAEAKDRFYSKADMYRKGSILTGLAAMMCFSVALSLRF